jgi:putative chitinase
MAVDWIWIVVLGALMGAVGQGVRIVIGLKKMSDDAATNGHDFTDRIEPARLLISLLIGSIAGVMAAIATLSTNAPISRDALLGLAAAGYAGADFIEGFMARYLPSSRARPPAALAGAEPPSAPEARPPAVAAAAVLAPAKPQAAAAADS